MVHIIHRKNRAVGVTLQFFSKKVSSNSKKVCTFANADGEKSVCRKECIFAYSADVKLGHFHRKILVGVEGMITLLDCMLLQKHTPSGVFKTTLSTNIIIKGVQAHTSEMRQNGKLHFFRTGYFNVKPPASLKHRSCTRHVLGLKQMYCSNCGSQVSNEAEKCPNCGAGIVGQTSHQTIESGDSKKKNKKKNKKKKFWIIGGIIAAVLAVVIFFFGNPALFMSGEDCFLRAKSSPDDEEMFWYLKKAAEKGHPEAMFVLGGSTIDENFSRERQIEGVEWVHKSAEAGYPPAQAFYGISLINGSIIPKNISEGFKWLETSANNGWGEAQKTLGAAYFQGDAGLPRDVEKAKYWLGKAAEQHVDGAADMLDYINYMTAPRRYRYNIGAETLKGNVRNLGHMALQNQLGY